MRKPAGTILTIAGRNYLDNLSEHLRNDATRTLNGILDVAASYNDQWAEISVDVNLTPQGRDARITKVTEAALTALAPVEQTAKQLIERAAALKTALLAKAAPVVPKDHESALREIRDQMRTLTPEERLAIYRASATDPLVLAAIETAPPTLGKSRRMEPFVDPTELASVKMARAEAADPSTAAKLRDLESLAEVYRLSVNSVRQEIMATAS